MKPLYNVIASVAKQSILSSQTLWIAASAFGLLAMTAETRAQDALVRQISVQGEASQMVVPDQAIISFSINSEDRDLQRVKQMQDEKLTKLYGLTDKLKIDRKKLKTHYANLHPRYDYLNRIRVFKSYEASVNITITLDEMDKAGETMQKLIAGGFDQIDNIQYTLKDDQPIREAVQIEALQNAKSKASKMAAALGMSIGKPLQINESGVQVTPIYQPQPMMMKAMAMDAAEAAPAPPAGEQEIRQTISVTFEMMEQ